jgi:anti-sigma B factor antagonist
MLTEKLEFEPLPQTDSSKHVYRLRGPIVLGNLFSIQEILRSSNVHTVLDLTEVPYVDSAGLGMIINCYVSRQKAGQRLLLAGVNERVGTLFKVTHVDKVFETYPTLDIAIQALGKLVA